MACACGDTRVVRGSIPTTSRHLSLCLGCGEVQMFDERLDVVDRLDDVSMTMLRRLSVRFAEAVRVFDANKRGGR